MPTFDYHCPANGQTVEVMLKLHEELTTWGELCARKGLPLGDTPADAVIEKRFTSAVVMDKGRMGSGAPPPIDMMKFVGQSRSANQN